MTVDLEWKREGDEWVLFHRRRRMGRVVPDGDGMWRIAMAHGRMSDRYSLPWAKSHVLVSAERDLSWEAHERLARTPSNTEEIGGSETHKSSAIHFSGPGLPKPPLTQTRTQEVANESR